MSLKSITYTVTSDNLDKGKTFLITRAPAEKVELWAFRFSLGLAKNGIDIPKSAIDSGIAGIASLGISLIGKLPFEDAKILLDEMFECVQIMPSTKNPNIVRGLVSDDIEEVSTRIKLRMEVAKLHTGFSSIADIWKSLGTAEE